MLRIAQRGSATDFALIITSAYTGMRWGELAGLRWRNVDLARARLVIDPETGAVHEVGGSDSATACPVSGASIHM